jgi:phosphatidylethanolamine-binding protein (PEBP) family uncharacterized protein
MLEFMALMLLLNSCLASQKLEKNIMENNYPELIVECNDLRNGETFPIKYTGRGDDISPEFMLKNLSQNGKTIVIIFDDIKHHLFGIFNQWVIWNIPAMDIIQKIYPRVKYCRN